MGRNAKRIVPVHHGSDRCDERRQERRVGRIRCRTLRNCDGCEAEIARKLGAQQSMIGIVNRATQTDYYIAVVIRDTSTGKVIDSQTANFAGGEEGWASGVRMLIKHQVLVQ
jgi:hypothetical protein